MKNNTAPNKIGISETEAEHQAWCRDRGWTRVEDMAALWQAGSEDEYQAALAHGDANAKRGK